jgi:integrase
MDTRELHFHDLRGTAATRFYIAGLSERVIADIMGGEEEYVAKIIRRYVSPAATTKAIIHQLNRAKKKAQPGAPKMAKC